MRIGIFSDSINLPPKEGINVHTYSLLKALSAQPNTEVFLIVCDRGWLDLTMLQKEPFDTIVLPSIDFYSVERIVETIKDYELDILQSYMIYFSALVLGPASAKTKKPMVVEFHDLEKTVAPLYIKDKNEIEFHEILQRQAGSLASLVRIMSHYDYEVVQKDWPEIADICLWMPVCIEDRYKDPVTTQKKLNQLIFIGNTSYPPNNAAAQFIETILAPELPDISFELIGRRTERFKGPNLHAHGMLDDMRNLLTQSSLGLAPIFQGSGMKIKLLDYLSAGLPVLTTPLGAYGYPKSEAIIIEEDTTKWPEIIQSLVTDQKKVFNLSQTARQLFLDTFDLSKSIEKLLGSYRDLQFNPIKSPSDFPELPIDQRKIYWLEEVRETPRQPVTKKRHIIGTAR